jgi:hypothetical protein
VSKRRGRGNSSPDFDRLADDRLLLLQFAIIVAPGNL